VSIAAERSGTLKRMRFDRDVEVSTSWGRTSEARGIRRTSSNVNERWRIFDK
jgi:hypothetical protein